MGNGKIETEMIQTSISLWLKCQTYLLPLKLGLCPIISQISLFSEITIIVSTMVDWLCTALLCSAGDGRYDTPGHSARHCTYTMMDAVGYIKSWLGVWTYVKPMQKTITSELFTPVPCQYWTNNSNTSHIYTYIALICHDSWSPKYKSIGQYPWCNLPWYTIS